MAYDPSQGWTEDVEIAWREYLTHFTANIYPMFQDYGVSFDAALTTWFVNRLRNALDDDDAGNEPWKES